MAALAAWARLEVAERRGGSMLLATRREIPADVGGFERLLSGPGRLWVGKLDEAALGFVAARPEGLPDGTRIATVEALYVLPEARGVGLGEALMEEVLSWATEIGACGVESVALPGDRATKNFFERYGLVARALLVHRRLPIEPAGGEV